MPLEALKVSKLYGQLSCPILLIAGDGDKIASFKHQSVKLAQEIGCEFHAVKGAGHMVHHIAPDEAGAALDGLIATAEAALPASSLRIEAVLEGAQS